jgi:hypothetical protein
MKIFLAPRSNETSYKNFLSTIESGLDYSIVEPYLDKNAKNVLSGQTKLFAWGNKESKKASWDKMEPDDLLLFYKGREGNEDEGKFLFAGRLLHKQHDRKLGVSLWPPKPNEEPWTCVYFLKDLTSIHMPISVIRDLGEYDKKFDRVQGFMPLNDIGTKKILSRFSTFESFVNHYKQSPAKQESDLEQKNEKTAHSEAQMYILKIGRMLGYDTYSPNKSNIVDAEPLSKYISLEKLPTRYFGDINVIKLVSQIDVIWFKDEKPVVAFEVENTTKIGSGLQRLFPLTDYDCKLFVVAPGKDDKDLDLFEKYINNAPYFTKKKNFIFRTYKQLENWFTAVSENSAITKTFLADEL